MWRGPLWERVNINILFFQFAKRQAFLEPVIQENNPEYVMISIAHGEVRPRVAERFADTH